ncbi:hypothetical protein D3C73_1141840 [compost metagenome]
MEVLELGQRREAVGVAGTDGDLHVGVDDAGGQRDDARAVVALFLLDHARIHIQRGLGGAVNAPAGVRVAARAGRDVQHAAVGLQVFDGGQKARGQQHDGGDVQIERGGDGRAVDQGVGAGHGVDRARIVDQQIALGIARQGRADAFGRGFRRPQVREVHGQLFQLHILRPRVGGQFGVFAARQRDQAGARFEQAARHGGADAARSAGKDCDGVRHSWTSGVRLAEVSRQT